jgi:hypothetical protein
LASLTSGSLKSYKGRLRTDAAHAVALVLCEGEPIITAFGETKATELSVIVNLRNYVAVITRHAAGTAVISGGAYTAGLV